MEAILTPQYFKRQQRGQLFNYYEVFGGHVKRGDVGYMITVNFLNDFPIIAVEHNYKCNGTGTWDVFEVGTPITQEEYLQQFEKAIEHPTVKIY